MMGHSSNDGSELVFLRGEKEENYEHYFSHYLVSSW